MGIKSVLSILAGCIVLLINKPEEYVLVDDATFIVYMQKKVLNGYPEVDNCYSIDSIRITQGGRRYIVYGDYSEQEVFLYKPANVYHYLRNMRNIKCYTCNPYDNHYIYGGDRYEFLDNVKGRVVIAFKISCRLRRMIPNYNCWLDTSAYSSPNEFLLHIDKDTDEYCRLWDDYTDNRTFYGKDYYLIDSIFNYQSLDSAEISRLKIKSKINSEIINKYGTW